MSRKRPPNRLEDLVNAATQVFLAKGYRRAQIADVARAMEAAPGTVYLYVAGKEALFDLVIRVSLSPALLAEANEALPVPEPAPGATLALIRNTLKKDARITSLEGALKARQDTSAEEFETIVREIYGKLSRYWLAVKLIEKAAMDWPELASMWFGEHRLRLLRNLTKYFRAGIDQGLFRRVPNPDAAARLVIEIVAFFAMHRRVDPSSAELDEKVAEETVVDAILHAYVVR